MDEKSARQIWISIKHNYLHMNNNILDFGDLGEAMPFGQGTAAAVP